LNRYSTFSKKPIRKEYIEFEGDLIFDRFLKGHKPISDCYTINIKVPNNYPISLPIVHEVSSKIPREPKYHINKFGSKLAPNDDHYFCLGSEIRLKKILSNDYSLEAFVYGIVEPFLYSVSYKKRFNEDFPIGELAHYNQGLIIEYMELFAVDSINKLINVLIALSQKKRISNKRLCPCDCGTRLGKCSYHYHLNEYRNIMPRSRYASIINELKLSKT
jgi:hypothetical protein